MRDAHRFIFRVDRNGALNLYKNVQAAKESLLPPASSLKSIYTKMIGSLQAQESERDITMSVSIFLLTRAF